MVDKYCSQEERQDPVAVEVILSLLSTSVSIISILLECRKWLDSDSRTHQRAIRNLRDGVYRIQNALDDLVLVLRRYEADREKVDVSISGAKLTIRETLIDLRQKDYLRWHDIQDSISAIQHDVHDSIAVLRRLCIESGQGYYANHELEVVVEEFDALLADFAQHPLGEFVTEFRRALTRLVDSIDYIGGHNQA